MPRFIPGNPAGPRAAFRIGWPTGPGCLIDAICLAFCGQFTGFLQVSLVFSCPYIPAFHKTETDWTAPKLGGSSHNDPSMQSLMLIGYWNSLVEHITIQLLSLFHVNKISFVYIYICNIVWLHAMLCLHDIIYKTYNILYLRTLKKVLETNGFLFSTITSNAPWGFK